ncbi:hypothetical protein [Desulfonema limicola]|uniref:hypothetical protein n=1 Tax=Desulfonema limicola TaxID=45656 RepID=UPI001A9A7402|nr:hypothetical protein [Desulfonema limicola]
MLHFLKPNLDNLINIIHRELEPEDTIPAASGMLKNLLNEANDFLPSENWKSEFEEISDKENVTIKEIQKLLND